MIEGTDPAFCCGADSEGVHDCSLFIKIINPIAYDIFQKINFNLLANSNTTIRGFSNTDLVSEYIKIKESI